MKGQLITGVEAKQQKVKKKRKDELIKTSPQATIIGVIYNATRHIYIHDLHGSGITKTQAAD